MKRIKIIAFDADDTLWVNEPYYREVEEEFCKLMQEYLPANKISEELYKIEMKNLEMYGYGAKGFMLSMIETATIITKSKISETTINQILNLGKSLLEKPVELLDDIEFALTQLKNKYRLVVATKGDLTDQQRKLNASGLLHHFHHIEIMNTKSEMDYKKLLKRLDIASENFLMVGNSLKSDVIPVLAIGGQAVHIPFHTTWQHETIEETIAHENFYSITNIKELLTLLENA